VPFYNLAIIESAITHARYQNLQVRTGWRTNLVSIRSATMRVIKTIVATTAAIIAIFLALGPTADARTTKIMRKKVESADKQKLRRQIKGENKGKGFAWSLVSFLLTTCLLARCVAHGNHDLF
jgi:hypothetical protein